MKVSYTSFPQINKLKPGHNKEDFMWHVVPSMKSHVALHPVTWPYSMHFPSVFVFHERPYYWLVW